MTQKLSDFLAQQESKKHSTTVGTDKHAIMQNIVIDDVDGDKGDENIIKKIRSLPQIKQYFCKDAKTEIPIAGYINGVFISRRIDRLLINHENKTIEFIDYKTNTNKDEFIDKYKIQLKEYAELLCSAYPNYKISGYILWLHDWMFDKIIA